MIQIDMEMPSCCYDCDFSIGVMSTEVDRECTITEKYVNDDDRPDWCPLVDVPDEAGNCSEIPNNSDCVSRRAAVEAIANQSRFSAEEIINICDKSVQDENGWLGGLKEAILAVLELPSAQPKTTQVLAEVLDGCPLLHPCDELCKPEGWCRDHCKEGQNGPDKDCWMRYAEVMASERSD